MKLLSTLTLLSLLAIPACGKKEPAATPAAAAANTTGAATETTAEGVASASQPAPPKKTKPAAAPVNKANEALIGAVHGFMTEQLRIFIKQKGRVPENFAEFANARMDSVPRPPEGLHYDIDKTTVEVKLVRN